MNECAMAGLTFNGRPGSTVEPSLACIPTPISGDTGSRGAAFGHRFRAGTAAAGTTTSNTATADDDGLGVGRRTMRLIRGRRPDHHHAHKGDGDGNQVTEENHRAGDRRVPVREKLLYVVIRLHKGLSAVG